MSPVMQKGRAVVLGRNRIIGGRGYRLERRHRQLEAAGRPVIGSHLAGHQNRALLTQAPGMVKQLLRNIRFKNGTLQRPRSVANLKKDQLATRALAPNPTPDLDLTPAMRADIADSCPMHGRDLEADPPSGNRYLGDNAEHHFSGRGHWTA